MLGVSCGVLKAFVGRCCEQKSTTYESTSSKTLNSNNYTKQKNSLHRYVWYVFYIRRYLDNINKQN